MKDQLKQIVQAALIQLAKQCDIDHQDLNDFAITNTKNKSHGDFATNVAMVNAKIFKRKPKIIALNLIQQIIAPSIEKIEIAGPGFINFFLKQAALVDIIPNILKNAENFGKANVGNNNKILIEFVSSNPTGPLHVGHGRGAAFGASLANVLAFAGFDVTREYYVNDAGRQMHILAASLWLRYLQLFELEFPFPNQAYQGEYLIRIAEKLRENHTDRFLKPIKNVFANLSDEKNQDGSLNEDKYIDSVVRSAKQVLGNQNYNFIFNFISNEILDDIKDDLKSFGVEYQNWFHESEVVKSGAFARAIANLQEKGYLYKKDGAIWFCSTQFGDEKDRVVIRENGETTYFGNDIAYHENKLERKFDHIINIFGADHHGYAPRIDASIQALTGKTDVLTTLFVQFAILYRGKERLKMSTRSGSFVTLRELREEVGKDAARFFYVMRKSDQHMDFDLDLAKSQSSDNPVYYIQYAHARIASVLRQLAEKNYKLAENEGLNHLTLLEDVHEKDLMNLLARFPEVIKTSAINYEPHLIANYLKELAYKFHIYYNSCLFIVENPQLRNARLCLILAVKQVLANALHLLGVSALEAM